MLITIVGGLTLTSGSAHAADNYPAKWKNAPLGDTYDDWGMATRYCTSWVAWALHNRNGFEMPFHDDAEGWGSKAAALGYAVDMNPAVGAVAWWDSGHGGGYGHLAYVESVGATTVHISEYNFDLQGNYHERDINTSSVSGYIHFRDVAAIPSAPPTNRMLFARGDDMLFAKDNLGDGWTSGTGSGWLKSGANDGPYLAAGGPEGKTHLWISSCGALYAKNDLGADGWIAEAECGTAKNVAISNTGLQMMVSSCGAVYAKYGIGVGGWWTEADCGTGAAVAAGGDTQVMLGACGAVYAKDGLGWGGWTEEAPCGTAAAVAVSSSGLQMMLSTCGAVYAKYDVGVGGWWAETDCGWATAVAAGGDTHMFLGTCGAVYAKTSMGMGGWTTEAECGTAKAVAIGSRGRQMIITVDNAVFVKDALGVGGWTFVVGPGNAKAIAVS